MRHDQLTTEEEKIAFMNSSDEFYLVTHFQPNSYNTFDMNSLEGFWHAEKVNKKDIRFSEDGRFPTFYFDVGESILFNDLNEMDGFLGELMVKEHCDRIWRFGCNFFKGE